MKHISFLLMVMLLPFAVVSCMKSKSVKQTDSGVSDGDMDKVEQGTKPLNLSQMPGVTAPKDSFIAFRIYLSDGNMVSDSTVASVVYGKLNPGIKNTEFRIETKDANGRVLGTVYPDNVFSYRSCDDGNSQSGTIRKGWIEVYVPYHATLETVDFIEEDNKSTRQISMKTVRENLIKRQRNKK
ncbi:MAG TPA: hypothetical protein VK168_01125 [Saprospiraceae bacterium]|nr:hypothetical protein [Saprospiraceae bacterium]